MAKYTGPSEHEIQVAYFQIVEWRQNQDERWSMIFAIPNGGHRNAKTGAKMKREGVRKGVPDIFISVPSNGYNGAYFEVKRPDRLTKTKTGLTAEQGIFFEKAERFGYFTAICYSVEELQQATEDYFATAPGIYRVELTNEEMDNEIVVVFPKAKY